jgi:hypothetical protein
MKTLLKLGFIILLVLVGILYFSSKTEFADFQSRTAALARDIRLNHDRPAKYYQWASGLESEWEGLRQNLQTKPMTEGIIKQYDEVFERLMRDIKADREKAGKDLPQVLPST